MGNKAGSVRKLDNDTDSDEQPIAAKSSSVRKKAQAYKSCETEPTNRRRSSGGNGDSSSSSTTATSKKKCNSILSEHQKQLISRSWRQHVNRHSTENIGVRILFNLFDISPEIKQFFGFADTARENLLFDKRFQKQAKAFVRIIDDAVRDIENLEEVQKRLRALGAWHVKLRSAHLGAFKMQHWDAFAEAMLESIIDSQRGVHKYRDTTATWRIFITWIIGIMKQGYYETLRAERRATTVALPPPPNDPPARGQGMASTSAEGPSSASGPVPSYSRNHSVSYAHSDMFHQLPPPVSPAIHHQRFFEPTAVTTRSAPHSPYVVNPLPKYSSPRASQTASTRLHVPYEPHPKRSLPAISSAEQQRLLAAYGREDALLERSPPRGNYDYAEETDYEYGDEVRHHDGNYSRGRYYSDYY